jgi:hemin uptake protein HemP
MAEANSPTQAEHPVSEAALVAWTNDLGHKLFRFDELARCGEEIWIEHNRQLYRLRKTRQGKLILTK